MYLYHRLSYRHKLLYMPRQYCHVSNHISITWMKARWNFHRLWITKIVREMGQVRIQSFVLCLLSHWLRRKAFMWKSLSRESINHHNICWCMGRLWRPQPPSYIMCMPYIALHWRHNGRGSVWNPQPNDCLLNRLFRRRSKKTSKRRVTGLWAGNSPGTGEFPAQMTSNAENVFIWWRHHGIPNRPYSSIRVLSQCWHINSLTPAQNLTLNVWGPSYSGYVPNGFAGKKSATIQ